MSRKLTVISLILILFSFAISASGCKQENTDEESKTSAIGNLVVISDFSDRGNFSSDDLNNAEKIYNGENGVSDYFEEISLRKTEMRNSVFDSVVSSGFSSDYFLSDAYSAEGYDTEIYEINGKKSVSADAYLRERQLICAVAKNVAEKLTDGANLDCDSDGILDCLTIVIDYSKTENSEGYEKHSSILWPHMSSFTDISDSEESYFFDEENKALAATISVPEICGLKVEKYVILSSDYTCGLACHEMIHVFDIADYYSYINLSNYVDSYDIMGAFTFETPQYPLSYTRLKMGYLTLGKEILDISESGEYKLYPTTSQEIAAYRIITDDYFKTGEYFYIECRSSKSDSAFDKDINGDGLIVYRINEERAFVDKNGDFASTDCANMFGGSVVETELVSYKYLYYYNGGSRSEVPELTYSDGTKSGISINSITAVDGNGYVFNVCISEDSNQNNSIGGKNSSMCIGEPYIKLLANGYLPTVMWSKNGGEGTVKIVGLRQSGRLSCQVDFNSTGLSSKDIFNGKYGKNEVVFEMTVSASARHVPLKYTEDCYVFVAQKSGGKYGEVYVLPLLSKEPERSFSDFISAVLTFRNRLFNGVLSGLLIAFGLLVGLILAKKTKITHNFRKKN